jgi:phage gp16-like protein
MNNDPYRNKDLARIHLAKKELGLDDDAYRELLKGTTGKISSAELSSKERYKLLCALQTLGAPAAAPRAYPGRPLKPSPDKARLIGKIEALLTDAKRPWAYADGMARHMFQRDLVRDCDPGELVRIVAALTYDAKRREAKASKP